VQSPLALLFPALFFLLLLLSYERTFFKLNNSICLKIDFICKYLLDNLFLIFYDFNGIK